MYVSAMFASPGQIVGLGGHMFRNHQPIALAKVTSPFQSSPDNRIDRLLSRKPAVDRPVAPFNIVMG